MFLMRAITMITACFNIFLRRIQPENIEDLAENLVSPVDWLTEEEERQLQYESDWAELNAILSDLDAYLEQEDFSASLDEYEEQKDFSDISLQIIDLNMYPEC